MIMTRLMLAGTLCALVLAATAAAGTQIGTSTQTLFNGVTYPTSSWFVGNDAPPFNPTEPEFFEPEGMTFYRNPITGDAALYVSGDSDETSPTLVSYPLGDFTAPNLIPVSAEGSVWGPEGITVNTSGAGYGAFDPATQMPYLTSVESGNDPDETFNNHVGAIDLNTSPAPVENLHQPFVGFSPDDIAYVPSADRFAIILDPGVIGLFEHDATSLELNDPSFEVNAGPDVGDAKGLATISEGFAELITGLDVTGDVLLVAHESNHFSLFGLDGAQIGAAVEFTSGLLPAESDESEIEAIAVDELNQTIYVGDEAGLAITAIVVPEPTSLGVLAVALLTLAGRRRG